jgi:hypothetical protein
MKDILPEDQLNIHLDNNGIMVFRQYARLVKWMFIGTIFFSLLVWMELILRNVFVYQQHIRFGAFAFFFRYLYPLIQALIGLIVIFQIVNLKRFVQRVEESHDQVDSEKFNRSFTYLYKSGILTMVQLVLSLGLFLVQVVTDITLLKGWGF